MIVPIIISDRLRLRPYGATDSEHLKTLFSSPEVMKHTGGGMSAAKILKLLDKFSSETDLDFSWLIELETSGKYVGHAALRTTAVEAEYDLAVLLLPDLWGQGYGSEVMQALLVFAKEVSQVNQLIATIDVDHIASRRLVEKAGMRIVRWEEDQEGRYPVYGFDVRKNSSD